MELDLEPAKDGKREQAVAPPGLRILVPGWPQAYWGQNARALVFSGSFLASVLSAVLGWGSWEGWIGLLFAFFSHVASTADSISRCSFPRLRVSVAVGVTAVVLGTLIYAPGVFVASEVAWPGFESTNPARGYLVDYRAYRRSKPREGEWIWMQLPTHPLRYAAQVVALPGQTVEWTGREWKVDGQDRNVRFPAHLSGLPQPCSFTVPEDQLLVEPDSSTDEEEPAGMLVLIPDDLVIGRAWAQYYPVWERKLL